MLVVSYNPAKQSSIFATDRSQIWCHYKVEHWPQPRSLDYTGVDIGLLRDLTRIFYAMRVVIKKILDPVIDRKFWRIRGKFYSGGKYKGDKNSAKNGTEQWTWQFGSNE